MIKFIYFCILFNGILTKRTKLWTSVVAEANRKWAGYGPRRRICAVTGPECCRFIGKFCGVWIVRRCSWASRRGWRRRRRCEQCSGLVPM